MQFCAFKLATRREHNPAVPVWIQDGGHEPEVTELRDFRIDELPSYKVASSGANNSANYERISMRFWAFKSAPRREQQSAVSVWIQDGGLEPEVTELRGFRMDERQT